MLTGKAKVDFYSWLLTEGNEVIKNGTIEYDLYYMCKYMIPENMVCAKVIEWLDSVGLYIEIGVYPSDGTDPNFTINYSYTMFGLIGLDGDLYLTRQEATRAAIKQANKIYNEKQYLRN